MWNKIFVDLLLFEYNYENETFLNTMWCMRTSSHQMLEGITISVAIGKGLNPAPLLKMTVFTFTVCLTFFRFLNIPVILSECVIN